MWEGQCHVPVSRVADTPTAAVARIKGRMKDGRNILGFS
jgi:hypothetical protein